jgi:hypothetical protein
MAEMPETVPQLTSLEAILADYQSAIDAGKNPDPRAYLERAAELARAAAQAKTGEERKRRRLTVVLAAAVVLIVLGSSGAALWYFDDQARQAREMLLRQTESARKQARAEQDVRQNLKQAEEAHAKLLEELKKPGGVPGLLNGRPGSAKTASGASAIGLLLDRISGLVVGTRWVGCPTSETYQIFAAGPTVIMKPSCRKSLVRLCFW